MKGIGMNEIIPFKYNDIEVLAVVIDGEPWFLANDVADVLGYSNTSAAVSQHVDPEDVTHTTLALHEGSRVVTRKRPLVNESGLYALTFGSKLTGARAFKRWVTREVLPSIRKTGSYAIGQPVELTGPELMAKALLEANSTLQAQAQALLEAKPKVEAFEAFLSSNGDYSVGEAAKVLARDHQIVTGEKRLFSQLEAWGWIYRNAKGRPICKQSQIENGRLAHKASFYIDWKTGEQVMATPQVRITAKGIEAIAKKIKELMEEAA